MAAYRAAGVNLYALSYDEPDALADYGKAGGVTFTLLSDPDSKVIRELGILNTTIPSNEHPWYGIPFPGAYAMDGNGIIVAKFFEHNFAIRPGPEQMLAAATGKEFEFEINIETEVENAIASKIEPGSNPSEEVSVEISFEGDLLPTGVTREIVAKFHLPQGQHLYAEPAPEGLVAAVIEVDHNAGILTYTPRAPQTSSLTLTESGDTLQVYQGNVVLRLPVAQNSRAMEKIDGKRYVTISGKVRWQICDGQRCGLPQSKSFSFRIETAFPLIADMGPGEGRVPAMNGAVHFQKMKDRNHIG